METKGVQRGRAVTRKTTRDMFHVKSKIQHQSCYAGQGKKTNKHQNSMKTEGRSKSQRQGQAENTSTRTWPRPEDWCANYKASCGRLRSRV